MKPIKLESAILATNGTPQKLNIYGDSLSVVSADFPFMLSFDGGTYFQVMAGQRVRVPSGDAGFARVWVKHSQQVAIVNNIALVHGTALLDDLQARHPRWTKDHPTITLGGTATLAAGASQVLNPWTTFFFAESTYSNLFVTAPATTPYQQCEVRVSNLGAGGALWISVRENTAKKGLISAVPAGQERVIRTRSQITVWNNTGAGIDFCAGVTFYVLTPENWWQYLA